MDGEDSAYPSQHKTGKGTLATRAGLTKREEFAKAAMQGMLANSSDGVLPDGVTWFEHLSKRSVKYADALLKALSAE